MFAMSRSDSYGMRLVGYVNIISFVLFCVVLCCVVLPSIHAQSRFI